MTAQNRQSTGVAGLDEMLGGGLLPGTLTVVVGSTGIGKTQLGLQFAEAGLGDEHHRGVLFDVAARGDSQNHAEYASRMFDWELKVVPSEQSPSLDDFFGQHERGDYLHVFDYRGQRVTKRDLEWDEWRSWQVELNAKLRATIAFLYGNFVSGTRRVVIDGVEPTDRPHESIQLNLCEYIYHQILRKDPEWVARDLFREQFRLHAQAAASATYDNTSIGCLMLSTSHESMLDDLISRPLSEGDALSNANTLIYMGKTRDGSRIGRGMYIAKHRGSACSDEVVPYRIDDQGLHVG